MVDPLAPGTSSDETDRTGETGVSGPSDEAVEQRRDAARRGLIAGVVGRVAPAVLRTIDTNDLVDAVDVNAIAADLDLEAIVDRLDLDAIADRLDLDLLIDRLDLDAIANRLDLDLLIDRLDVNAIANRLDLDDLVARVDMAQLTAGAAQDVAGSGLDLVRRQLVRLDTATEAVADRFLRRTGPRPEAPPTLTASTDGPLTADLADRELRRRRITGHYGGPITRLLAFTADVFGSLTSFGFVGAAMLHVVGTITGLDVTIGSGHLFERALLLAWMLAWFWFPVALIGRTPVMAIAGLAVVRRDGEPVESRRALVRALALPISTIVLAPALVSVVVGRERRGLHDVVAGTVVVYDWGSRPAERPVALRDQLAAQLRRRQLTRNTAG
ncbi:MAG: RDD family protein [Actinomycetota bacterium]|nr:RDD family protein [Actinomycetota bacterium]